MIGQGPGVRLTANFWGNPELYRRVELTPPRTGAVVETQNRRGHENRCGQQNGENDDATPEHERLSPGTSQGPTFPFGER